MRVLRTPEPRFRGLPGFDLPPRYADVPDQDGGVLRMAWVEDGPANGPVVVLLHGEPSWSFLYRTTIPALTAAGLRVVAPDLVGFGRSDKPADPGDHSYARHVEWVRALLFDVLDLRGVTLVGQDWGGLIGLRLVGEHADRFAAVVAANTGLPTGDHDMPEVWWQFRRAVEKAETLDVARLVQAGCRTRLTPEVRAAYDVPFPDESFKAGPRAMPTLVPTRPDDPALGGQPRGLGGADEQRPAVPLRVQRRRPDHRGDGTGAAQEHAGRGGPRPPDDPRRGPLPAGGRRRGPGQRNREIRDPDPDARKATFMACRRN